MLIPAVCTVPCVVPVTSAYILFKNYHSKYGYSLLMFNLLDVVHVESSLCCYYSWIADQPDAHETVNLLTNQKGYDNSETTVRKLLARRIQIFRVYFSMIIF